MDKVQEFTRWKMEALDGVRLAHARLGHATRMVESGRDAFTQAVREAHSLGISLSTIGREVGLSRQRVHGIVKGAS